MPIFEYECPKCKEELELIETQMEHEQIKYCPECGEKMCSLISQSTFRLKGLGWYVTDYK